MFVSYLYTTIVSSRLDNYLVPRSVLSVCSEVFYQVSVRKLQKLCKIDACVRRTRKLTASLLIAFLHCYRILTLSLKSSCPVNSGFYCSNWYTIGFKSIKAIWQHPRQRSKSPRATTAAVSPSLQSVRSMEHAVLCWYFLAINSKYFYLPAPDSMKHRSVSELKLGNKSENSEIWFPECQ